MSTLRGPAQLADLQGALCTPTNNLTNGVDGRTRTCAWDHNGFRVHSLNHSGTTTVLLSKLLVSDFGPSCWSPGTYHTDDTFQVRADDTALRSTLLPTNNLTTSRPLATVPHPETFYLIKVKLLGTARAISPTRELKDNPASAGLRMELS